MWTSIVAGVLLALSAIVELFLYLDATSNENMISSILVIAMLLPISICLYLLFNGEDIESRQKLEEYRKKSGRY